MDEENLWSVAKILEYAMEKYCLSNDVDENGNLPSDKYKKQIRRTIDKNNLRNRERNYLIPEDKARQLVDEVLKYYFENDSYLETVKKKHEKFLSEQDILLNEQSWEEFLSDRMIIEEYKRNGDDKALAAYQYEKGRKLQIESNMNLYMDRFMLRAIFERFYDFDKENFCADFRELFEHISEDDYNEPYIKGYSALREKLANPIKYYCKLKDNK